MADQNAGVKVKIPTHIMYSEYNLGRQFDVEGVWKDYTDPSAGLTVKGVGEKRGHFIIEEAPGESFTRSSRTVNCADNETDEAIAQLEAFMDRLGVASGPSGAGTKQSVKDEL